MAQPTKDAPKLKCTYCKKIMERKRFSSGRLEDLTAFKKRRFCDQLCMALDFNGRDKGGRSDQ